MNSLLIISLNILNSSKFEYKVDCNFPYNAKGLSMFSFLINKLVKYFANSPSESFQSGGNREGIALASNSLVIGNQLNWFSSR